MSKTNKIVFMIMVLLGGIIIYSEVKKLDFVEVQHSMRHLHWIYLLVALLFMLGSWLFEAYILKACIDTKSTFLPLRDAYRVILLEQVFNAITPMASGGQPAQLMGLVQSKVEGGKATSVLLLKFIVYQFIVLLNFILALFIGFNEVSSHFSTMAIFIIFGFVIHFIVVIVLSIIMFHYATAQKIINFFLKIYAKFVTDEKANATAEFLDQKVLNFHNESVGLLRQKRKIIITSILTFLQLGMYYTVPYFIILAFGIKGVSFMTVYILQILIVMIISLFPIPGGAGGAEYSFSTLFRTYITNNNLLILAMLLWRFFTYYLGMFMGAGALFIHPKTVQNRTNLGVSRRSQEVND